MNSTRRVGLLLTIAVLTFGLVAQPALAASAQLNGNGLIRPSAAEASFTLALDDAGLLVLDYWDFSSNPPRNIATNDTAAVECLGELFGGQAIKLTGSGYDSGTGEAVSLQLFLVDGAEAGPDRISLKVRRPDGRQVYFVPLRDLESGDLTLTCG